MIQLFTIGYAQHTIQSFISLLKRHQIGVVADVRSVPFSQYSPDFNREPLIKTLKEHDISYVFLGDKCGARISDRSCYRNGKVDYSLVAKNSGFQEGLTRIDNGISKFQIALMCAEKDPINCHRTILICKNLRSEKIKIFHILKDGSLEEHSHTEKRLLKLFGMDQADLFMSPSQQIETAYSKQAEKIAYREHQDKDTEIFNQEFEDGQT